MLDLRWKKEKFKDAATQAGAIGALLGALSGIALAFRHSTASLVLAIATALLLLLAVYFGFRAWHATDRYTETVFPSPLLTVVAAILALGAGFVVGHHATSPGTSATRAAAAPSPHYAAAVNRRFRMLGEARAEAHRQLRAATTPSEQAEAARRAQDAVEVASAALRRLHAPTADAGAHRKLVAALTATAHAYGALARAAQHQDARAFARMEERVRAATHALGTARVRFRALGYDVAA